MNMLDIQDLVLRLYHLQKEKTLKYEKFPPYFQSMVKFQIDNLNHNYNVTYKNLIFPF